MITWIMYTDHIREYKLELNRIWKRRYDKRPEVIEHRKEYNKKNRVHQKEYQKEYQRKYKKRHPEKILEYRKKSLKVMGNNFDLNSKQYNYALIFWSKTIKKRDGNICQVCGTTRKLHAHHIFFKSLCPKLSLNINNGITLCVWCHSELHGFWCEMTTFIS